MREAVGSTFLFKLMIIFIFFFAAFLAIAINYSQAFRMKNSIISSIEKNEGVNTGSIKEIETVINNSGYFRTVNCTSPADEDKETTKLITLQNVKGVCIYSKETETGYNKKYRYYQVTTYVSFNLPIVGSFFTFPVKGETKVITNPVDNQ